MKKSILLFTVYLMVVGLKAQVEYTPFQFENSIWQESDFGVWFTTSEYEVSVEGDTIIDDKTYYKLFKRGMTYFYDSPQQYSIIDSVEVDIYLGAIRENDVKLIEYITSAQTIPVILYDFNLEVGDTTQVYDISFAEYVDAEVISVDTVEICGSSRNRYALAFFPPAVPSITYLIEGIGSTNGILPTYELFESASNLRCYSNSTCNCFNLIVNTQQDVGDVIKIQVYPNPVSQNSFRVSAANAQNSSIKIYNHLGQSVYENTIDLDHISIDCSNWPNGCYFLKITDKNWQETKTILLQRE